MMFLKPDNLYNADRSLLSELKQTKSYKAVPPRSFGFVREEGVYDKGGLRCACAFVSVPYRDERFGILNHKYIVIAYTEKRIAVMIPYPFYGMDSCGAYGYGIDFDSGRTDDIKNDLRSVINRLFCNKFEFDFPQ